MVIHASSLINDDDNYSFVHNHVVKRYQITSKYLGEYVSVLNLAAGILGLELLFLNWECTWKSFGVCFFVLF